MAENQNPYMSGASGRRGAHFASQPQAQPPVRRRRSLKPLIVILVLAALAAGGYFGWQRFGADIAARLGLGGKTIEVVVDGKRTRVPADSTVQQDFGTVKPEQATCDHVWLAAE